jgi:hypothetical protein
MQQQDMEAVVLAINARGCIEGCFAEYQPIPVDAWHCNSRQADDKGRFVAGNHRVDRPEPALRVWHKRVIERTDRQGDSINVDT